MASSTTRTRMTAQQKMLLFQHHALHPELSLRNLSAWACAEFKLTKAPSRSALCKLLKAPVPAERSLARPTLKTAHTVTSAELESALVKWIAVCEALQLPVVTLATIRARAEKLRGVMMRTAADGASDKLQVMLFSVGWAQKLVKRHGLKQHRVHGEAASARADQVEKGREELLKITQQYKPCDVFNFDESAFFYCMAPSASITKSSIAGRKKQKKRLTVAITSNADGSTKLPLLFVGTARQPRCFGKSSAKELGVDYTTARNGWMTTQLFGAWVTHFDAQMRTEDRHVLLLLDNASAHRVDVALTHVSVHFLPPNNTAHLQPQDAGVIRAFKSEFNKLRNARVVDTLDDLLVQQGIPAIANGEIDVDSLYNITVLDAMRWAQAAWAKVTPRTVSNCWRHMGIIAHDVFELVSGIERLSIAPLSVEQLAQ